MSGPSTGTIKRQHITDVVYVRVCENTYDKTHWATNGYVLVQWGPSHPMAPKDAWAWHTHLRSWLISIYQFWVVSWL